MVWPGTKVCAEARILQLEANHIFLWSVFNLSWEIGLTSTKKVGGKYWREKQQVVWSGLLWAGDLEDQQKLGERITRDRETKKKHSCGCQHFPRHAALPAVTCCVHLPLSLSPVREQHMLSLAEGHSDWSLSLTQMRFSRKTSFIHRSISSFLSWQSRNFFFFFILTCELNTFDIKIIDRIYMQNDVPF